MNNNLLVHRFSLNLHMKTQGVKKSVIETFGRVKNSDKIISTFVRCYGRRYKLKFKYSLDFTSPEIIQIVNCINVHCAPQLVSLQCKQLQQ